MTANFDFGGPLVTNVTLDNIESTAADSASASGLTSPSVDVFNEGSPDGASFASLRGVSFDDLFERLDCCILVDVAEGCCLGDAFAGKTFACNLDEEGWIDFVGVVCSCTFS